MRQASQCLYSGQSLQDRVGAVGKHEAGIAAQGVIEDANDVLDDKRLAAGERELFHAQRDGFVEPGPGVLETDAFEPVVAGFRAFQTKRTGEIAGGAGMEPEFEQGPWLNVAGRW